MFTDEKKKLAVLASGNGTNLEAIIGATRNPKFPAIVRVVLSDQKDAFALERARRHKIAAVFIDPKKFESRQAYDQMLVTTLKEYKIDFVILAGFMRILSPNFIKLFSNKILNIHPALLPQFRGLNAVERALKAGVRETGVTIHFVDEGVDTGPIVIQERIPIQKKDTLDLLLKRVHKLEHSLYPKAIQSVICQPAKQK